MERSFKKEIGLLRLGDGEIFHGEGILAVTKALLQSGVSYVGGYQGAPISHLMDVLSDAEPLLDEYGVHFEVCANEASAAAMLSASVNYPIRGAVTWKSVVGTNVASDGLSNLSSAGVTGGALIIVGEDYGEGSSIIQERTHAFAMKSSICLLDPRPELPTIVDMVEHAFRLSEASNMPSMLELRIRTCHVHGHFTASDNAHPKISRNNPASAADFDLGKVSLPPATYTQEKHKIEHRLPAAIKYISENGLNESLAGDVPEIGVIVQGGIYNTLMRALHQFGLADVYGQARLPIFVMNVTYPLVPDELVRFCAGKDAVLVVEEGQPDYIEQALHAILRKADVNTVLAGKDVLPMGGEYTSEVMIRGLAGFLEKHAPPPLQIGPAVSRMTQLLAEKDQAKADLGTDYPLRQPSFCTGCPERPIFSAIKILERELGPTHVSADIGCHTFAALPPFNVGHTVMGYGLGLASSAGLRPNMDKRVLSIMGDGGFWHNGISSGVAAAQANGNDAVLMVIQNGYTSATGWQKLPSSATDRHGKTRDMSIHKAMKGLGVGWIRTVRTYSIATMIKTLREAMTTAQGGLKVIIADGECQLARQRRIRPQIAKQLADGDRVVRTRFGVDDDVCTGDHSCIRLSGCPSITIKPSPDPLRTDPVAHVNNDCVGCGVCGEVAHAAVLCPSFYEARIVQNPGWYDRLLERVRRAVIARLAPQPAVPSES
ncbi:MAG: indolepyruvate ferredoxin oxidoreductase subunit alpha [Rhodospirillaceae bacterium]|jgi:indolepyruvate ferredoxin oxidoreductase alpha subunit|nr:indolepyruvate ferredoxin oxidoreductase subunit alpha [Rhodospirillaceae bacterium]MBT5458948.1 indolepyruvate ferredoxin oxidoreductase subunit alpha [Rhodospirillaceae bacterium]